MEFPSHQESECEWMQSSPYCVSINEMPIRAQIYSSLAFAVWIKDNALAIVVGIAHVPHHFIVFTKFWQTSRQNYLRAN